MLSKKMAFSLMRLITLLALAFAVPSAMAAEFAVSLDMDSDISHADGLQLEWESDFVTITVKSPHAIFGFRYLYSAYDADGVFLGRPVQAVRPVGPTKEFDITIQPPLGTTKLALKILKGTPSADPFNDDTGTELIVDIDLLGVNPISKPDVLKIALVGEPFAKVTSDTFDVHVLLSEAPHGGLTPALVNVGDNATVSSVLKLASPRAAMTSIAMGIIARDDNEQIGDTAGDLDTWRDGKLHLYLVTIATKPGDLEVSVKINNFDSQEKPSPGTGQAMYIRDAESGLTEGRDKLTVKTNAPDPVVAKVGGFGFFIGHGEGTMIPAGGYLVLTKDKDKSGIAVSNQETEENVAAVQTPAKLLYNVRAAELPNLENFFGNGGTVYLTTSDAVATGSVVISEVMWGSDAAEADSTASQWIELHNTTATAIAVGEKKWALVFLSANELLPAAADTLNIGVDAAGTVVDSVGTRDEASGVFWSIAGKGNGGRTDINPAVDTAPIIGDTVPLISMQRASSAGVYASGTAASSWSASTIPALNFIPGIEGSRVGTPGASPVTLTAPPPVPPVVSPNPVAAADDIAISEIMVDTGNGRLPQWIELTNVSGKAVSLAGWSVLISNSKADDDVVGALVSINLSGTLGVSAHTGNTGKGQSLLLVAWDNRSSSNFNADLVMDVSSQVGKAGRYTLISEMAFMAALVPPQETGVLAYGDVVGNLGEGWELPMSEGGRSSLIRREADALGTATLGTAANGWILASDTVLVTGAATWYGSDEDAGTPGYDGGGPLPVSLSHFRPARDEAGAAVITWSTQSELNNAGFFIKRSQQRDGQFKVINAAMIQGAGTTGEKQFYTYTDTTAQPNVVYYYQIEDVSLDGNRQTLTNGIRLKGHIGAAGKLTTLWGDLKTSQ